MAKKRRNTKRLRGMVGQVSQREAARQLGISRAVLRARLAEAGLKWVRPPPRPRLHRGRLITEADVDRLRAEAKDLGYPDKPLPSGWRKAKAAHLGVTGDYVRQILKHQKWK